VIRKRAIALAAIISGCISNPSDQGADCHENQLSVQPGEDVSVELLVTIKVNGTDHG
jgi:hypothetical protein